MWDLDDGADEHPNDTRVDRTAVGERGVHFGRGVEITTAVGVVGRDSGSVSIREGEGVHLPPTTVEARISGGGCRNIWLQATEVIDRVEAVIWGAGIGQVGWGGDGAIEHTIDVESGTTDAT